MRTMSLGLFVALLMTAGLSAQEAGEIKLEHAKARAIAVTQAPRQAGVMHEYPLGVVFVFLDSGKLSRTSGADKKEIIDFKAGDVMWYPAGSYKDDSLTDTTVRYVKVEPKSKGPYSQGSTKLDAPVTDPTHYKVLFDNPQVRALRITFPPHSKGELHEHLLDRAVVDLTRKGGLIVMPGSVRVSGYNIHIDANDTDQPQERIAIELK